MPAPTPSPTNLREALARSLYEHDSHEIEGAPIWEGDALDSQHPGLRERYLDRADVLVVGPLADLIAGATRDSDEHLAQEEELRVLRRQRMAPERERELLEANNRLLEHARAAAAARASAEAASTTMQRERDVAREAESFWQQFAFDADDLATQRLINETRARGAAERTALIERNRRERVEGALHLFADRADVMPKEGWVSDLVGMNRDIPLWWFHAARVALGRAEPREVEEGGA